MARLVLVHLRASVAKRQRLYESFRARGVLSGEFRSLWGLRKEDKDSYAEADRAVCNIKGWPVIRSVVDIKEVDHGTKSESVHDVSDCAAHDQGQCTL